MCRKVSKVGIKDGTKEVGVEKVVVLGFVPLGGVMAGVGVQGGG
jgi:hypothetical protein